ncbi:hypothetical protein FHY31_002555 [Xanthomonas euvesicatoria]|uniref:Uncharacterized protein n=1 Tax=Xanthomonas euvesicatoria TaxID=456327 RepID=A0AAW3U4W9_XANEU|nr:hypothetical protein [Xanthomonas euvesicatoria]MBB4870785.1 hypothetical protein [Xanthomonas euvesicatoria]
MRALEESVEQKLSIATSTIRQVPNCSHMNMAIINEQITLQCSIAVPGPAHRREAGGAMSDFATGMTSSYNGRPAVAA